MSAIRNTEGYMAKLTLGKAECKARILDIDQNGFAVYMKSPLPPKTMIRVCIDLGEAGVLNVLAYTSSCVLRGPALHRIGFVFSVMENNEYTILQNAIEMFRGTLTVAERLSLATVH